MISAPRSSQKADKSAREEMVKLFRDCDNLLEEQLDKLMLIYQATQPDFCTEYANAREIGGWKKDKKKEEGGLGVPEK